MNQAFENLAILIPTRNRPGILATTLKELQNAGLGEVPLWIYDDCSADAVAIPKAVEGWPGVRVITGKQRVGQAEGRNVLMRACGKEFGLFLDDDSFPRSVAGLQKHLVHQPELRRAVVTFQYMDVPTQRYSTPVELPEGPARSFQGGGSLFHIPTILGLGGFRSFFIYGYEEPELSCRLQMNGFHIWYEPSMVVLHNHFETPAEFRNYAEYHYLYARNSILMSSLNMPLWLGLPHGLVRSVRRSFFQRKCFRSKIRGTADGIWQSFALWRERTPGTVARAMDWIRFSRTCSR
jgi:GT2 family glycosyltransferase